MKYDEFYTGELMFNHQTGRMYIKTDVYPYLFDLKTGEITWLYDMENVDFYKAHVYTIHRR